MEKVTELREYDAQEGFKKAPNHPLDNFKDDDEDAFSIGDDSDTGLSKRMDDALKPDANDTKPLQQYPPPTAPLQNEHTLDAKETTHTNNIVTTPLDNNPITNTDNPLASPLTQDSTASVPVPSVPDVSVVPPAASASPTSTPQTSAASTLPPNSVKQTGSNPNSPKVSQSHSPLASHPSKLIRTSSLLNASGGYSSDNESKVLSYNERLKMYEDVLQSDILEINLLRELAWQGIPETRGLRAKYWKILLHYLPTNKLLWESSLSKSRKLYQDWVNELVIDPHQAEKQSACDHPLSLDHDSKWNAFFKDNEILIEIDKDVKRTFPHLHFFNQISPSGEEIASPHYHTLKRILFIYAKLNPGIRYVQGMNELLGPIYYTFATDSDPAFKDHAECDAFFCFTHLMSEVMDNFCKTLDKSEMGIVGNMRKLNLLFKEQDPELWNDLEDKKMNPQFYSFRWLTLLLSQEFELPEVLRLWDSLFADPDRFEFFYCFCCAMLLCVREKILDGSFADNLKLLQSYPPIDFKVIFGIALQIHEHTYKPPLPRKKPEAAPPTNHTHTHHQPHAHPHTHAPTTNPVPITSKISLPGILHKISPSSPSTRPKVDKPHEPSKPMVFHLPMGLGKFQI